MPTRVVVAQTKEVRLVIPNPEDAEILVHWINDPEVNLYLGTSTWIPPVAEKQWLERKIERISEEPLVVIEYQDELVGTMGVHNLNLLHRHGTTGSLIGKKELWGKGIGTQAKMLFLNFLFMRWNLERVYSAVIAFNTRSKRYSEKCGYIHVATFPNKWMRNGTWHDELILEVTRENWLPLWEQFQKDFMS